MSLKEIVKKRIDNYIGFNSDEIFQLGKPLIFGGAIRDSISSDNINDIDIMCHSNTAKKIHNLLESKKFKYHEGLSPKDISHLYKDINVISEPHTYINETGKIIQVIRPRIFSNIDYIDVIDDLIKNVDISCCGISYNGEIVKEHYKNAILHASCKIFKVNNQSKMYLKDRVFFRIDKLLNKGWVEFYNSDEEKKLIRDKNLNKLWI